MKMSHKAALMSAFVFPGAGHFYLKRYGRALIIIFIVVAGLGYVIWSATLLALKRIDEMMAKMQGGATDLQALSDIARSNLSTANDYSNIILCAIIGLWIFAIIDAYQIGKQRENENMEAPPL